MQVRFWRRSDFRPTRMRGVVGQKCRTSGYHWKGLVSECDDDIRARPVEGEDMIAHFVHNILQ